ncbi:MAG: phosphopyruvate hydratase [Planctomycetota bacterium]
MKINKIRGRQILDSRGNPTLEVELHLNNGITGISSVPSGASRGTKEAIELRDSDNKKVLEGKAVYRAIEKLGTIEPIIKKESFENITLFDKFLIELDGTENKRNLGGNVILGLSLSFAKALALSNNLPLYRYIKKEFDIKGDDKIPVPLFNFINGGVHADNNISIQEFFLIPHTPTSFKGRIFKSVEVFYQLKKILKENSKSTLVGDEGGFAPELDNDEEALEYLTEAINRCGYRIGADFTLGLDCAGSQLYQDGHYSFFKLSKKPHHKYSEFLKYYLAWVDKYNITVIEDPFAEQDYQAWRDFTKLIGDKITIVGDDIYCTNIKYIEKGIKERLSNAVLIKPNQIGTIYETFLAVKLAKENNFKTAFSHRSGETEDVWASHLAVAFGNDYVKFGGLSRSERLAKYNELLRIEENILSQEKQF